MVVAIAGARFGRLVAIKPAGSKIINGKSAGRLWTCICDCGTTKDLMAGVLRHGKVQSCGCTHKEGKPKHGHGRAGNESPTYMIWKQMTQRCKNPRNVNYKHYGARGITVCDEWSLFENFLADMGERPEGLSLDRIDNNSGYCKENCRWATLTEQANNKRNNRMIEFHGKTQSMSAWARELGLSLQTISWRINQLGIDASEALRISLEKRKQ